MGDHLERACTACGSLLHHEDDCLRVGYHPEHNLWMAILYAVVRRQGSVTLTREELRQIQEEIEAGARVHCGRGADGAVVVGYVRPERGERSGSDG